MAVGRAAAGRSRMSPMKMSAAGRAWLKGMEGLRLVAYPDGDGWSIGYGHHGAHEGQRITLAEAEALFERDLVKYEAAVNAALTRPALQTQFDALVSFAYNVGTAGMAGSTVVREHNAGNLFAAARAFDLWNKSQGKVSPVLVKRRDLEEQLYVTGVYSRTPSQKAVVKLLQGEQQGEALLVALVATGAALWLLPRMAPRRFARAA